MTSVQYNHMQNDKAEIKKTKQTKQKQTNKQTNKNKNETKNPKAKQKNVLSQSSRAHSFAFARPFVFKWQIHFIFLQYFFFTFLPKI